MDVKQMRAEVRAAYSSPFWAQKVEKMTDKQIAFQHYRLKLSGKIR